MSNDDGIPDDNVLDDSDNDEHGKVQRWVTEIRLYEKEAESWEKKCRDICKRYKDQRNSLSETKALYNFLWASVQTLLPALYSRNPKADIGRRNKKKDELGLMTGDVLERTSDYFIDTEDFYRVMTDCVLDRLLAGRGTAWVRYVPHFRDVGQTGNVDVEGEGSGITDDIYAGDDNDDIAQGPNEKAEQDGGPTQEVYFEEVCFDYVHWQDFGHSVGRTWSEVRARWRKVYLTRNASVKRFGDKGRDVPLDYSPKGLNEEKTSEDLKKSTVYEIWDEETKKVYWLHKDLPTFLDVKDDPLGLKDFWPCPTPLLATTANDTVIPVPDYIEYQDQAKELDRLTGRIASLTKCIKAVGVRDASAQGLERMLAEGTENTLIPVDQWTAHAEKGGLKGVVELLPMLEVAQTLQTLYEIRDKVKQDLYDITGIADIIRGQSDPDETMGAQKIKSKFATLRLSKQQKEVQRFARDMLRIATQIISKHFSINTIKDISGVELLTNQEKMMIQQYIAMQKQMQAAQSQQQPGPQQAPGQQQMGNLQQQRPPMPMQQQLPPQAHPQQPMQRPMQ